MWVLFSLHKGSFVIAILRVAAEVNLEYNIKINVRRIMDELSDLNCMEKQLVLLADRRTAVFAGKSDLLQDEMNLRTVAYMLGDVFLPMCCMLCNMGKLSRLLGHTRLCTGNAELTGKLAKLIYDYMAQCKGLG